MPAVAPFLHLYLSISLDAKRPAAGCYICSELFNFSTFQLFNFSRIPGVLSHGQNRLPIEARARPHAPAPRLGNITICTCSPISTVARGDERTSLAKYRPHRQTAYSVIVRCQAENPIFAAAVDVGWSSWTGSVLNRP